MSSENIIRASGLGKAYLIYNKPVDRLKQMLFRGRRQFYEEYWALRDVDIELARGETVGIIGRNGSGKSTFLQLVCGTIAPTTGTIESQGRVAALLELGAGFNPEFTGRENIYLAATVQGLSSEQIRDRLQDIINFAGIGDFIDQPVKLYSSGMYARLAFAVAAHVDADILIVDEILGVGDAAFAQKCMRFIHRFRETGTLLFVSHDAGAVTALCDRAIWLDSGSVRHVGPAKEICDEYAAALQVEGDSGASLRFGGTRRSAPQAVKVADPRAPLLKTSTLRNDIEVFTFERDAAGYGEYGATIEEVKLKSPDGSALPVLEGGEDVILRIECAARRDLNKPIIGFYIRDRLGQMLFGDNTFITYRDQDRPVSAGERFIGEFRFQMPYLPTGDYSVCPAVATGTQSEHTQQHWVDDALFFRVHSSHVAQGLIGIPMQQIRLYKAQESAAASEAA